jgi:hypothetical protein
MKYLEEAYHKDPYAFAAFRLGIGKALQGDSAAATKLWEEADKLSWGGDATEREMYSALLRTLRGDPSAQAALQKIIQRLETEGAAGVLDGFRRDVELIRRSGRYDAEITPVMTLLESSIKKAREAN